MAQKGLPNNIIDNLRERFQDDQKNQLAQAVCMRHNPLDVLRKPDAEKTAHVFTHKVDCEGKPVTDQKSSGRCWIFACLNCMRIPFVKEHSLDNDFEFSENYVCFWDKVERCRYLLDVFVDTARRGEAADGRLVQHLLQNPAEDGGQWHMLVNVIEKHGIVPKKMFPDTWNSENSRRLNLIINSKMREFCLKLRTLVKAGSSDADLEPEIDVMMQQIYRVVSVCLGTPPKSFVWEYYDKDKAYQSVGPISPLEFYQQHVKPFYNMEDKVVLVNDARPENPYRTLYTVDCLGNMTGGSPVLYINLPIEELKTLASDSIKGNQAVWFGCDVNQHCSWRKFGLEDLSLYDYDMVFGTSIQCLTKAERLLFRESLMTHAMVLTAFSEQKEKITKWRIENSWGDTGGEKGYMAMTDDWFSEYVLEVVVDKKFVSDEVLDILKQTPRVLPAWDPMGALATPSHPTPHPAHPSDPTHHGAV